MLTVVSSTTDVSSVPNNDAKMPPSAGEKAIRRSGNIIFFINELPFDIDDVIDEDEDLLDRLNDVEYLAATYLLPQQLILSSQLNAGGCIRAIYVNFGPKGYYEISPMSRPVNDLEVFRDLLEELFENEMIRDHGTNQLLCRRINDLYSLLANFPVNSTIVGCLDGEDSIGTPPIREYLGNVGPLDYEPFVFVVGQILNQEIEFHIEDWAQVSEYELDADLLLLRLIDAVENRLFHE